MDRGEREEAPDGAAADRAAVGRATVPAEKGQSTGDRPDAKDNGRGDRPPVTASARVGGGASGRAGVLTSPPPSAPGSGSSTPSGSLGAGTAAAAPTSTPPGAAPNRLQRPAGLATVGGASAPVNGAPATSAGRVAEAVRSARSTVSAAAARGPRRARLFVKRVDPWSVMKFSFAVSFVLAGMVISVAAEWLDRRLPPTGPTDRSPLYLGVYGVLVIASVAFVLLVVLVVLLPWWYLKAAEVVERDGLSVLIERGTRAWRFGRVALTGLAGLGLVRLLVEVVAILTTT